MAPDPTRPARSWRAVGRHPQVLDALLGLFLGGASLLGVRMGPDESVGRALQPRDLVMAAAAVLLVTVRRRWPVPVLAAATIGAVGSVSAGEGPHALVAVTVVCAYTVASRTTRRTAWVAGVAAALPMYAAGLLRGDNGWFAPENIGVIAWTGLAVALGDGLRTRRAYVAAVEERARRAEESRDAEALRRVVEERLRIARELHDVVAHHIAMINVQAGVAAHVLRQQPDQAEEALRHVREAARTVLDELSTVLGVLRQPGDPDADAEPTRGLGRLPGLLDSLAAAGLRVEHRQDGAVRDLPASVDLAAYRIVQESLTNAQKHGSGPTARLRLGYHPEGIAIVVENPVDDAGPPAERGTGHGLTGMRERAGAVGGSLRVGPDGSGGFAVRAFLPSPERPVTRA